MGEVEGDYRDRTFSQEGISKHKAERMLKANLQNVEVMRNRLKVLTSQSEYNQFRSRYQTEKIERHQQIHEEAIKERQIVVSSLQARSHSRVQERKANNEKLRCELKEKLSEVFGRMKLERAGQSEEVKAASLKNRELLAKRRQQQLERKKSQHEEVVKMEVQIK
jgi:hypothetical protein